MNIALTLSRIAATLTCTALIGCRSHPAAAPSASASQEGSAAITQAGDAGADGAAINDESKLRRIAAMLKRVEKARSLESTHPVEGKILSRHDLIAKIRAHMDEELPAEVFVHQGNLLKLLKFVPTSLDYRNVTYSLLESEVAGYYAPSTKTMYMADDLADGIADITLAHELVHALQDQRWDLGRREHYTPGESDRTAAFAGLGEGDATSAMFEILLHNSSAVDIPDAQLSKLLSAGLVTRATVDTPRIMRKSLLSPYLNGLLFINALRRRGGWKEVELAWKTPPETTEQLLHVSKWDSHEPAENVPLNALGVFGDGWKEVERDSYGELGFRLSFEEWTSDSNAEELATGWGGDTSVLLTKDDDNVHIVRVRFDPAIGVHTGSWAAEKVYSTLAPIFDRRFGPSTMADRNTTQCLERKELGPLTIAWRDRDVLFVAGPATVRDSGWTSAGDCKQSRAWARALLSK